LATEIKAVWLKEGTVKLNFFLRLAN